MERSHSEENLCDSSSSKHRLKQLQCHLNGDLKLSKSRTVSYIADLNDTALLDGKGPFQLQCLVLLLCPAQSEEFYICFFLFLSLLVSFVKIADQINLATGVIKQSLEEKLSAEMTYCFIYNQVLN